MKVEDFGDLTKAEAGLIAHLRAGKPGTFIASTSLPAKDASKEVHIRASLIRALALNKLQDCPLPERGLQIKGAYIYGDGLSGGDTKGLDFDCVNLTCNLKLFDCCVPDPVLFRNASIVNLYLNRSHLSAGLKVDGANIRGNLSLREVIAEGAVNLLGLRLGGNLDCIGGQFKARGTAINADRLRVVGRVAMQEIHAKGKIRLIGAEVGDLLTLSNAEVALELDPDSKNEPHAIVADHLMTNGHVDLTDARLKGEIRLRGAKIEGDLKCKNADLHGLDCRASQVKGTWLWIDGAKSKNAINFSIAKFGTIHDDPACLPTEILLNECRYGAFLGKGVSGADRIAWLSRMQPSKYDIDFWPQPYEECARALREAGHGTAARKVLIEKECLQRQARHERLGRECQAARGKYQKFDIFLCRWLLRFADLIIRATIAYGRRPLQAFVPLLFCLLIGAFVFGAAAWSGQIKPNLPQIQRAPEWVACGAAPDAGAIPEAQRKLYQPRAHPGEDQLACFLRQPEAAAYPRFNPLIYSADTLLPIVSLEMQSYWIPDDRKPIGNAARLYLWLHIAAGWALTLLAVAGFSGLIKTDNTK